MDRHYDEPFPARFAPSSGRGGQPALAAAFPEASVASGSGPEGWNVAVLDALAGV